MKLITFVVDGSPATEPLRESEAQLFWSLIKSLGIPEKTVKVVALTKKSSKEGITDDDVVAALPALWNEFRLHRPDVVVSLGLLVSKYLTGHGKLKDARGSLLPLKLPKKLGAVPADLADIVVTGTAGLGAIWFQEQGQPGAEGRNQFIEDVTRLWQRLNGQTRDPRCDYKWLESYEEIDAYFSEVERAYEAGEIPGLIIDVETNQHLDAFQSTGRLVSIGFSHKPWFARGIKVNHKDERLFATYGEPIWKAFQKRFQFLVDRVPTGGWNFKFDIRWLRKHAGVRIRKIFFEGLAAHAAIYSELKKHDLKFAIMDELGTPISEAEIKAAMAALKAQGFPDTDCHMGNVDEELLLTYMGGDCDSTFRLVLRLDPMLDNDHFWLPADYQTKFPGYNHRPAYNMLMLPSTVAFSEIEDHGVLVDKAMLKYLEKAYPERIAAALKPIIDTSWGKKVVDTLEVGKKKNGRVVTADMVITSYSNLSRLLYDEAGFPTKTDDWELERNERKSKNGSVFYYSTGKDTRDKLKLWAQLNNRQDLADLITSINAYSKLRKLYTAYVVKMHDYIKGDGFMRTTYNLTGTRTGRASTSKPSLHTIPKKSDIKKLFISRWQKEGGLILQFDYSQLEVCIIAAIADDPELIAILTSGRDTHRQVAGKIFKLEPDQVSDDQRNKGKTINFGVLYGMGVESLAARTGMTIEEAKLAVKNYFEGLKKVKKWIDKQKHDVNSRAVIKQGTGRKKRMFDRKSGHYIDKLVDYQFEQFGYIDTVFGRKRILKDANHWIDGWKGKAERQAFNTPIQSAASDLALWSLMRIHARFNLEGLKSLVFGWIHDSIEVDVYPGEFLKVYRIVKEEMEEAPKRFFEWIKKIPVKASSEVGQGWGYLCEIKWIDRETNKFEINVDNEGVDKMEAVLRSMKRGLDVRDFELTPVLKDHKVVGQKACFVLTERVIMPEVVKETKTFENQVHTDRVHRKAAFFI